jgi:serine protease AprX
LSPHPLRSRRARRLAVVGLAAVTTLAVTTSTASATPALPTASKTVSAATSGLLGTLTSLLPSGLFDDVLWGDTKADDVSTGLNGKNDPGIDPGSLYTIEKAIGARQVWLSKDSTGRQVTGQGVTVAVLDSGTATVAGLDGAGKVTYGPDLSIESNGTLTDKDTFGHGTVMSGIIAVRDKATLTTATIPTLSPAIQLGVAPDASLLSLKLATTDGSTDVSQIIAALDWVTAHPTNADGSRIRVINLSFGTDSLQSYQLDPLAAAAENAWHHGIVVVVSGGNEGSTAGHLTNPAIDPYLISVGAATSNNVAAGWVAPRAASFSNSGSATRHVDLIAPGQSIAGLRTPGSFVDTTHPEGRVRGDVSGRLFRGSGTSQAAAVVSGAVALLLQAYPTLTPDQVKAALVSSATPVLDTPTNAGAGELNVAAALAKAATLVKPATIAGKATASPAAQSFPIATGQGSLNAARGGNVLVDADGNPLDGEIDVQGTPWNAKAWWAATSTVTAWKGGLWMGTRWTGDGWLAAGDGYLSARWSSARWSSARWSDADWSSARWSSARWSSARWSSARWSSARWSDAGWGGGYVAPR